MTQGQPPDHSVPFTTTMASRLLTLVDARALSLNLSRAAYLASLVRADLVAAGIDLPPPPPPKQNGPKSKKNT